jgi:hypothetical protein
LTIELTLPAGDAVASTDGPVDVSIVMPCLDEEQSVGECVSRARAWLAGRSLRGEVIVVDNDSRDASRARALAAGASVIDEPRRGYGYAYLAGFRAARGRIIVMGDADGTYDFSNLDPLIAPLEDGYDMVVGNRLDGGMQPGAMPILHRHIGTPLISQAIRLIAGTPVSDSQSGLRAIKRDALTKLGLKSTGMELASEMILKAARRSMSVTEVPVGYAVRVGESKLRTWQDGWRHLRFLLLNTPTFTFVVPGLMLCLAGLAALVAALVVNGVTIDSVGGQLGLVGTVFSVLGVMGLLFGVQAWGFSLRRGLVKPNRLIEGYRHFMTVERAFIFGAGFAAIALVIDLVILSEMLQDRRFVPARLAVAFLAQSLLIVGAGLVWSTLLGHMLDVHDEPDPDVS